MRKKKDEMMLLLRSSDHGLAKNDEFSTKLNEILRNVIHAAGYQDLPIEVHVLASPQFLAGAFSDGSLYISIGTLWDLRTEDEIAFLLAHEFAHVMKGHFLKGWSEDFQNRLSVSAELASDFVSGWTEVTNHNRTAEQKVRNFKLAAEASYEATRRVLNPARNRDQEAEADKIGIYLSMKAGYNACQPVQSVLEVMKLAESTTDDEPVHETVKPRGTAKPEKKDSEGGGFLGSALSFINKRIESAAESVGDDVSALYYPFPERVAAIKHQQVVLHECLQPEYRDPVTLPWMLEDTDPDEPPVFDERTVAGRILLNYSFARKAEQALYEYRLLDAQEAINEAAEEPTLNDSYIRIVFFRVRKAQGKNDLAMINLKKALKASEISFHIYEELIGTALSRRDFESASIYEAQSRKTAKGEMAELFPARIALHAMKGQSFEAQNVLLKCRVENPNVVVDCQKAAEAHGITSNIMDNLKKGKPKGE